MTWVTPTRQQLRIINAANVTGQLRSGPMIPNSVLRVIADSNAALAHGCYSYLDWQALQLLPDTCDLPWLMRWANMLGVSVGSATYAVGMVAFNGIAGITIPAATQLVATVGSETTIFHTNAIATLGSGATQVAVTALTPGETGLSAGSQLSLVIGIPGVNGLISILSLTDGVDEDTESEVRANVLMRMRQPPMGGDANDYVAWALDYPGCTRAWCAPQEMGIGTVTVRFMMDLRNATSNPMTSGFPTPADVAGMQIWIDSKRPVTALDCFVVAPIPEPVSCSISKLLTTTSPVDSVDSSTVDASTMANIATSLTSMLFANSAPSYALNGVTQDAQTIFAVWISDAILRAAGVLSFDISTTSDHVMPTPGSLAVLGNIVLSP